MIIIVQNRSNRVCMLIITGCNCTEPFLTRSIPNLQFDTFAVQLDRPNFKVNSNRSNKRRGEGVVGETEQQTAFANTCEC